MSILHGFRRDIERTFWLRLGEPFPYFSKQAHQLVDVGEASFGNDLAQNEDGFEGCFSRAYHLPGEICDRK